MVPSNSSFSINPSWPHAAGIIATMVAITTGLIRYTLLGVCGPQVFADLLFINFSQIV
jgi:hypothetical protein